MHLDGKDWRSTTGILVASFAIMGTINQVSPDQFFVTVSAIPATSSEQGKTEVLHQVCSTHEAARIAEFHLAEQLRSEIAARGDLVSSEMD